LGFIIKGSFGFSMASLPTFGARLLLEIILSTTTITAIAKSDRTTFTFLRTTTVPLLLLVDLALGYAVGCY